MRHAAQTSIVLLTMPEPEMAARLAATLQLLQFEWRSSRAEGRTMFVQLGIVHVKIRR
jgi:hypothetical protein